MPQVKGGPQGLNRTLETTYRSAINSGKSKGQASAIAWSAAKTGYKKEGGQWVSKLYFDIATLCKDMGNPAFFGDRVLLNKVGSLCVAEYREMMKEESKTDNENKSKELEDPSFTGESGPIWDHEGHPLRGSYLEHESGKADIGIKPTALGDNPIRGFNYDPSAAGSAGGRDGQEYTNQNVPTATHGRVDDRGTKKILNSLRNLQALTKGGPAIIKHPGHPDQGVHDPTGGRGGKPSGEPSGASREAVRTPGGKPSQKPFKHDPKEATKKTKEAYDKAKIAVTDTLNSIDRLTNEWSDAKDTFLEAVGEVKAVAGERIKQLRSAIETAYSKYEKVKAGAKELYAQYTELKGESDLASPSEFESWNEELSPGEVSPRPEDVYGVLDDEEFR